LEKNEEGKHPIKLEMSCTRKNANTKQNAIKVAAVPLTTEEATSLCLSGG
jgi:hypothetical protein